MNVQPDMKLVVNANDDVGVPFAALEVDRRHWPVTSLYVRTDCFGKTHWSHRFCADFVEPGTRPNCASHRRLAFNGKPDLGYSLDKQTSYFLYNSSILLNVFCAIEPRPGSFPLTSLRMVR